MCQPDNGEMALEITDQLIRSGAVDMIAVDSVAALVPRAELEGEIGQVGGCLYTLAWGVGRAGMEGARASLVHPGDKGVYSECALG